MKVALKLFIYLMLFIPMSKTFDNEIKNLKRNNVEMKNNEWLQEFSCIGDECLSINESFILNDKTRNFEARKRKKLKINKYLFPLIIGFLLIKSVILPLALKALAILSGKAVVLSLMSLILAAIIGLRTIANGATTAAQKKFDIDNMIKYKRKDNINYINPMEEGPYKFFEDNLNRKK